MQEDLDVSSSNSGIRLGDMHLRGPIIPILALGVERLISWLIVSQSDRVASLEEGEREALRGMPANVAVHQPGTRVVCHKGDEQVTERHQGHVAPRRVGQVQRGAWVEGALSLRARPEVMPVQMNGMELCE